MKSETNKKDTANRADELTRHIRNGAVTITGTADPAATVNYFHTGSAAPRPAERDASGRWIAPNVPMHPMSNGLVRIQFRVDQDGQAPSFRLSEFSVNKVTTAIGNDGKQKSAKPKVQTQGDRDFEAVRTHGVRSGIPRRNGNCYGSITNLPSGDTLAYDCEGNLACVSNTVSGAVSLYWYDQHGRRIAKSEAGLLTLYIWDGMDIIATAHADGTLREYFTRGIGIAGDVGSLVAETRFSGGTATTTYLHSNWRGDVVMATDTSGAVVGEYAYTTFGEQLSSVGSFVPRFTFSSKERDSSGLVYHGFRYYSPVLCRWISEDPIRESGGVNLYQFCGNDPVNGIDPYGEFTLSEWKEIGGAFAEGFGKGIAAGVDGMIPFVDPFTGVYADDCGNVNNMYRVSRHIGGFTRDAMIAVAIPNIGTWVKNPVMYEIGQTTVSPATWNTIKGLSAIDRGKYLVNSANGNYLKAALGGLGNFGQFGTTIGTGLTPGGNLLMLGGFEFVDYQTR